MPRRSHRLCRPTRTGSPACRAACQIRTPKQWSLRRRIRPVQRQSRALRASGRPARRPPVTRPHCRPSGARFRPFPSDCGSARHRPASREYPPPAVRRAAPWDWARHVRHRACNAPAGHAAPHGHRAGSLRARRSASARYRPVRCGARRFPPRPAPWCWPALPPNSRSTPIARWRSQPFRRVRSHRARNASQRPCR